MLKPAKRLQPQSYHAFRCIGAECEDTCCAGWIVSVDKTTYQAYQRSEDPELAPRFRELITIKTDTQGEDSYARIALSSPDCPFLDAGWCAIQKKLGEESLSIMCSQYPRVMNIVDDVLQRSLDLSCPEAARLVLLDPEPIQFDQDDGARRDERHGHLSILRTCDESSAKPYAHFREIRAFAIWLLQNRKYSMWERVAILGSFCDQLEATAAAKALEVITAYKSGVNTGAFAQPLKRHRPQPAKQLELVLELIVGRIGSDFTGPRLLDCYRKFMQSMDWTPEVSLEELGRRYAAAHSQYCEPFLNLHPHILENYLVSYVHRTLFPLGPQESTRGISTHHAAKTVRDQYQLMMVHYALIQTLLIGVAAYQKEQFGTAEVVQVIQSYTKAFEHSPSFAERALKILVQKGVSNCTMLALLIRN